MKRKVLVTGAAGRVGSYFVQHSCSKYEMRLLVHEGDDAGEIESCGEVVQADLLDLEGMKAACAGMDTVVHLAANANAAAAWAELLETNITGTYHVFAAAKHAGCRRVIFASSIHAVSGYPADVQVKTTDPVNPGNLYGVSKCFGEALGRYMAEKEGVSVVVLRIGAFKAHEEEVRDGAVKHLGEFVSRRDLTQLIERCIDAEGLQFAIFHGISDNRFKRLDISDTRENVGFHPKDDFAELNPAAARLYIDPHNHNVNDQGKETGIRRQL